MGEPPNYATADVPCGKRARVEPEEERGDGNASSLPARDSRDAGQSAPRALADNVDADFLEGLARGRRHEIDIDRIPAPSR